MGTSDLGIGVGTLTEDWSGDARYHEYTRAADPIRSGHTPKVPIRRCSSTPRPDGDAVVVPFDLSAELRLGDGPATSPALCASFVHLAAGASLHLAPVATSELWFVLRGDGRSRVIDVDLPWAEGDLFVLPAGTPAEHRASSDVLAYRVTDEPLLRYLGVAPTGPRFRPTRFPATQLRAELARVAAAPDAARRSRVSVLMATAPQAQTLTATHVLWAMYGLLPVGAVQRPHRQQSVALDLIIDCQPGCFTLLGTELDEAGEILDPVRVDWEPAVAFVTPPGWWHAHHNQSGQLAHLLPIQDAGLHTYLRSLDIRFTTASPG